MIVLLGQSLRHTVVSQVARNSRLGDCANPLKLKESNIENIRIFFIRF